MKLTLWFLVGVIVGLLSQTPEAQQVVVGFGLASGVPKPLSVSSTGVLNVTF